MTRFEPAEGAATAPLPPLLYAHYSRAYRSRKGRCWSLVTAAS